MKLKGMGTSRGKSSGRVRIITTNKDRMSFAEGDILVTRLTDPTMVPLMARAGGIICEVGGMTSHPSIVSRELGIPCIVAVQRAMELLKDGQEIRMDGESGEIEVVDSAVKKEIVKKRKKVNEDDVNIIQ